MLNLLSILIGAFALMMGVVAFIPLVGWLNWAVIPIAFIGLAVGVVSKRTSGRNLNVVVIIVCALRLMLGGGIF